MTARKDPVVQAIDDARALLDTLLANDWQELHVVSGDTEIFLARNGGGANPMRAAPPAAPVAVPPPPSPAPASERSVTAPHVATLVDALPVGTRVAAGDRVATLHVLDDREDVAAPVAGTILRVDATPGALLDYGASLLVIAETA